MNDSLKSRVNQFEQDVDLTHQLVHGDENHEVATDSGPIPSFAKLQRGLKEDVLTRSEYEFLGDYAAGIQVDYYYQLLGENGEFWRPSADTALPYTTTGAGMPEDGAFVAVGDAALRADLGGDVANGRGARHVSGAVFRVNTLADLKSLDTAGLEDGAVAVVSERGEYTYSASANQFFPSASYHNYPAQGDAATRKRHHPTIPHLPMADMGLDGQAVHPCVVKIPQGFGPQGFTYWMAVTPYQDTDDQTENPCIYGSWDGATWHVPEGVTNPLAPSPGTSIDHNSDPCLLHHNGELWYYYRETLKSADPREDNIYVIKSSDGATWSTPAVCTIPSGYRNVSPAVVHNDSEFVMYLLRIRGDIVERRTSADGIAWSEPEAVSFVGDLGGTAWHFHVIIRNNRYEMIVNAWSGPISFATSPLSDGLTFTTLNNLIYKEYPFESSSLYYACLTPEEGDTPENYEIWYSAQSGTTWTVARVSATLNGEGLVPVFDRRGVSVFGPLTAGAGHFSSISTKEPIENLAILTGLATATGTTRHRRAVVASTSSTASGDKSAVVAAFESEANRARSSVIASGNSIASGLDSIVSASTDSIASGDSSAVIASSNGCKASGIRTVVLASIKSSATSYSGTSAVVASTDQSEASGPRSAVMTSITSTASGDRSTVVASTSSTASGDQSAVVAAFESEANRARSSVIASGNSIASGLDSIVSASTDSIASGDSSAVIASTNSTVSGPVDSAVIASLDCLSSDSRAPVIASRSVENNLSGSVAMGVDSSGVPSTANQTLRLEGSSGTIRATNTTIQGMDYAELFENGTGAEIEPGTLLTLDAGGRVVPADASDSIVGVVSHTYGLLGGESFSCWNRRYLKDEWGRDIWEEVPDPDDPEQVIKVRKENPDYDPDANYVPRLKRPAEWTTVGLLGQVLVRVGENVSPGDSVAADAGVGVPSEELTGVRCIGIRQPFDAAKGYAIAACLINIRV